MACFLGLFSTVLLVIMVKQRPAGSPIACSTSLSPWQDWRRMCMFGPLFATQALWVLATHVRARPSRLGLLRLQIFTFIVATPLVAIAAYQRGARRARERSRLWKECSAFCNQELSSKSIRLPSRCPLWMLWQRCWRCSRLRCSLPPLLRTRDGEATDGHSIEEVQEYGGPPLSSRPSSES